jgi:hypothetical protein
VVLPFFKALNHSDCHAVRVGVDVDLIDQGVDQLVRRYRLGFESGSFLAARLISAVCRVHLDREGRLG